jgi:hypothetical protein
MTMNAARNRFRDRIADHWAAVVILVLYVVLATAYNLADPLFEPPDELLHFDFIRFLQREGRLPIIDLEGPATEYHQPPLYYAVAALITAPLPKGDLAPYTVRNPFWGYQIGEVGRDNKNQYLHDPDLRVPIDDASRMIHLTRALSTVFGCGTVALAYLLARRFLPRSLAVASMAIVAFTPNYLLTSGAVTNDSLVILLSVATGLVLVNLTAATTPVPVSCWLVLGVLLGLGMQSKLSAWPLLPLAMLAAALHAIRLRAWRSFLIAGLVLVATVTLLEGWWVVRNLLLYGDPTGLDTMWTVWGERKLPTWNTYLIELRNFRTTFWANFGYGNVPLPSWVYTLTDLFVLGGALGLVVVLIRGRRDASPQPARRDQVILLVVWVVLTGVALVWYLQRTLSVTGRQLYPVLPVIALGLAAGWGAFVPDKWKVWLAGAISALMFVFAVGACAGVLIPAYERAPRLLDEEANRVIPHGLGWQMGSTATLLGYGVYPPVVGGGQKVTVTLYWEPTGVSERNYTVFVHLIGRDGESAGVRDTYPGLGNDPSIYWRPGEIIADAIPIPVAPSAQGPVLLDIEAGLYDLKTGERLTIHDAAGNQVGYPVIGTVKLLGDASSANPPPYLLDTSFEQGLGIEGYDLSTTVLSPGTPLTLTLYWSPTGPLTEEYVTFVHLVDEAGQIVAQGDGLPFDGRYPTTDWAAGEHLEDPYALVLPADVPAGTHYLLVGLYDPRSNERLLRVGGGDHIRLGSEIVVR